ncbi:MAG: M14 family zinc carboxypeptidase [Phycisphaerales bacterium]
MNHTPSPRAPCHAALLAMAAAASAALAQPTPLPPPFEQPVRYDGHKVIKVRVLTPEDRAAVEAISNDPWDCSGPRGGWARYRFAPDDMDRLRATGLPFEVQIDDLQALADAEARQIQDAQALERGAKGAGAAGVADLSWYNAYKTYDEYSAYSDQLVAMYPGVVSRIAVGTSLLGNPIWALRIAAPGAPADRPAILLFGLQHAREWVTGMSVMYLAEQLASGNNGDPQVARALASFQFFVVPVMNPDGYKHTWTNNRFWRKNRRANAGGTIGVDLNRNWSTGWGLNSGSSGSGGSETYRGPSPFSEPETQMMRDFVTARPYIKAQFDVHAYSQLILSPQGYTSVLPANNSLYLDLNAVLKAGMEGVFGLTYTAGPTYSTIYPASGVSLDWAHAQDRLGLSFECRDTGSFGFELPAIYIVPQGQEVTKGILNFADAIDGPVRLVFPTLPPPATVVANSRSVFTVQVYSMLSTLAPGTAKLSFRIGRLGDFTDVPMTLLSGNQYQAVFPPVPCGAVLQYTFSAAGVDGRVETVPDPVQAPFLQAATLRIVGGTCTVCPADFGQDATINPDDLGDYITLYFSGDPLTEFNNDGSLNPDDLGDFITEYFGGTCVPG